MLSERSSNSRSPPPDADCGALDLSLPLRKRAADDVANDGSQPSYKKSLIRRYCKSKDFDGCEPVGHAQRPRQAGRNANGSPSLSQSPPTTLLQNILQNRGANSTNIYSLQRGPNGQPLTTTNTSPLPPSPADSGVSDVDSHYSSNDEQQQQLNQYGYFYNAAHRSTCEYILAKLARPASGKVVAKST